MPWHIVKDHSECGDGKWAVVKDDDGDLEGCHDSEEAAKNVKRVALELGGKSANVILDDADLKAAVSYGVANCFLNSGQTCSDHTRMLVPRSKLAEAEGIDAATAEMMAPGDPFEEGSRMGPLVSDTQRKRVRE